MFTIFTPQVHRCWGGIWAWLSRVFWVLLVVVWVWGLQPAIATAKLTDDHYDGNIFVLYAGNGSLVPVHETLAQAQGRGRPVMLVFYVDDSRDCKDYAIVVSRLQEAYGRRASILPLNVDAIAPGKTFSPQEAGFYYTAGVPQTVILDATGAVRFNQSGVQTFEALDTVMRSVFDLAPAATPPLQQRQTYNEFNTELTN